MTFEGHDSAEAEAPRWESLEQLFEHLFPASSEKQSFPDWVYERFAQIERPYLISHHPRHDCYIVCNFTSFGCDFKELDCLPETETPEPIGSEWHPLPVFP